MEVTLRLGGVRLPRPPASGPVGEGEGGWAVTLSARALSWVSFGGRAAAGARTADGNQLLEAQRLGACPGPSPAPADLAKAGGLGRPGSPPPFRSGPGPWHVRRA